MQRDQKFPKINSNVLNLSSKFLPKKNRNDINKLFSFVNIAKGYASDNQPKKLLALEKSYKSAISDTAFDAIAHKWDDADTKNIKYIVRLQNKHKFEQAWVEAFFESLKMDVDGRNYKTLDQSLEFVYGTAEVVALMGARILSIPEEVYDAVRAKGRAIQWMDFIKDIAKDADLGKSYFPAEDLKKYDLEDLSQKTAQASSEKFNKFVQFQINRYRKWQIEANKSIHLVPERLQISIRTTTNMYDWIAKKIANKPMIVYQKHIMPSKQRVIRQIIKNSAKGSARVSLRTTRQVGRGVKNVKPTARTVIPKIKQAPAVAKEKAKEIKDKYIEIES